jgi:hypothetical protein
MGIKSERQALRQMVRRIITLRNVSVNAAAFAGDRFVGEVASLGTRLEIDDMYPRSSVRVSSGGFSRGSMEDARNKSSASRMRFSGPPRGIQLNRSLVSHRCLGSVGLATHS